MRFLRHSVCLWLAAAALDGQEPDAGRSIYQNRCAACHGGDGNGGERAPGVVAGLIARNDQELAGLVRDGLPGA
ncbi:MAG: c-type cytochrome, partial [Bryobacteraceae bacterium]